MIKKRDDGTIVPLLREQQEGIVLIGIETSLKIHQTSQTE